MAQSHPNHFTPPRRPATVGKQRSGILTRGVYLHFFAAVCFLAASLQLPAQNPSTELRFADFNSQGAFNNFSGDSGSFAAKGASIAMAFDTTVFHGTNGASLRIDYSLPSGYCGVWNSLSGKDEFQNQTLNFTNLYAGLRNSSGNPSQVENVHVTNFSFWARGNGLGDFTHSIKLEFKSTHGLVGSGRFSISNQTNWTRFDFPISDLGTNDLSTMKEVLFVIEDWKNDHRTNWLYLDDLAFTTDEPPCDVAHLSDDQMLDIVSQRAFAYFWRFTDDLGFALDRSSFSDTVSVGAIGFQLGAYCIGHERGWADKSEIENRVVRILQNLNRLPTGPEPGINRAGYRGFYYHFLAANIGNRKFDNVELSPYDTMLLMGGILTCEEYFKSNLKIQALTRELFDRVEWDWLVDHSPGPNSKRFFLFWMPGPTEAGTFHYHVDGQTDEALMMDLLALGSKAHPVKFETYLSRNRVSGSYPPGNPDKILASWQGSLFNYFFLDCWIDLRRRGSDRHPSDARNLWQNDVFAVTANRKFCLDHASKTIGGSNDLYATYGVNAWGLTACDSLVAPDYPTPSEYCVFGALPTEENMRFGTKPLQLGTLAVYGAGSSMIFLPQAAIAALRHDLQIPGLWSPLFGLGDAYSVDPHYIEHVYDKHGNPRIHYAAFLNGPWINNMIMGVDIGPMLLAIENYRSGMIWDLTAKNPEISAGLDKVFGPAQPVKVAPVNH